MRHSFLSSLVSASALAVVIATVLLSWVPVFAQAAEPQAAVKAAPARLSDGRPDLQGIWGFATVTPLNKPLHNHEEHEEHEETSTEKPKENLRVFVTFVV
jgi:hypothetical protein